jgi:senataxin
LTICGLIEAFLSKRPHAPTVVHAGRNTTATDKGPPKKILICAPSNAAIDEVAYRVSQGSRVSGKQREIRRKVVRIGADKSINVSVKDIALEFLIEQRMQSENVAPSDASSAIANLRVEIESVKRLRQEKLGEASQLHDNAARFAALQNEIKQLNSQRMVLTQRFDKLKDKQKSDARTFDATRRKFRAEILTEADIICSTLSGAGHDLLEQLEFEMVIIDEAAQAIELSSLIPLRHNCRRCIMVGGMLS